jgi:serine/threonine protein kinase
VLRYQQPQMNRPDATGLRAKVKESTETTAAAEVGPPIPDYELLRRIGVGAYGKVWLARSSATGVLRAIKIVHRTNFKEDRPFQREFDGIKAFESASRSHPSQLELFHVGRNEAAGYFYYVMELADAVVPHEALDSEPSISWGNPAAARAQTSNLQLDSYVPRTLRQDLQMHGCLPAAAVLKLGLALTEAVVHLHTNGLVHRDIKPSNIIFVSGRPKLADIGLVSDIGGERSIVGTEGYLAPEGPGTPQADLFALGKVLYEALTGLDRRRFPELPATIGQRSDSSLAFELNAIIVKACAGVLGQRYANASAMMEELQSLSAGHSVRRQRQWQRSLGLVKKLAFAAGVVGTASIVGYWLAIAWPKQPDFLMSRNAEANEQYREGVRLLHNDGTPLQAMKLFQSAIKKDPQFAEAYAQLAGAWLVTGTSSSNEVAEARWAAQKAVALNPYSSSGHALLASIKLLNDLDWAGAEKERRLAVKLNARGQTANPEEILLESAANLAVMGRTKESFVMLTKALSSPESMSHWRLYLSGRTFEGCRQFDQAIRCYEQYLQAVPGERAAMLELEARAFLGKGNYSNALHLERTAALERREDAAEVNARYDRLEKASQGNDLTDFWRARLEFERPKSDGEHLMRMASILARLSRRDEALADMQLAMRVTPPYFATGVYMDPSFDMLREDKRFQGMVSRLWGKK